MIVDAYKLVEELVVEPLLFRSFKPPRDEKVFLPDARWITEKFTPYAWRRLLKARRNEAYDCDDIAMEAVVAASRCLAAAGFVEDCGHSFLECEITIPAFDNNGLSSEGYLGILPTAISHQTNLVRCKDAWYFYELQTRRMDRADILIARRSVGARLWVRV